jgi:hypothetical protein
MVNQIIDFFRGSPSILINLLSCSIFSTCYYSNLERSPWTLERRGVIDYLMKEVLPLIS